MGSVVFSSTYSTAVTGSATYNVRVGYSESYNQAANATTLSITSVELQKVSNSINWGWLPFFGSVAVNGTTLLSMNGGASVRVSLDGSGYCSVAIPASGSVTVTHNPDGTKSVTFSLSGGFSAGGEDYFCALYNSYPFGVTAQSKSVALTARTRASSIASCPSSIATQDTLALTVNRSSTAYYHKAVFKVGTSTLYTSAAFATSLSFAVPRSWFSSYPSSSSLSITLSVQTYSSSACTTAVGSAVSKTLTVTADAGMKPTLSSGWATAAPYNTGTAAASISGYVKGCSKAQVSFDASKISHAVGATLGSYSVSCQGVTVSASPYRTGVLASTEASVVCTVTDSRGRSASETLNLSVMDYAAPSIAGVTVFRCTSGGTASEDGTYYSAKASASFSALGGQNSCTLSAAIAASSGSYGTGTALTSGTARVLGPISADMSYTVRITATDSLGNAAVYYAAVPPRKWAMKFRPDGSGVAFGKAAELNQALDLPSSWTTSIDGVSTGGPGYCRLPDGTLLQWGTAEISENKQSIQFTFPKAFSDTLYGFAPCGLYSYSADVRLSLAYKTTTGIAVYRQSAQSYSQPFSWVAMGRWK